jgi:dihydroneopterin aldolase
MARDLIFVRGLQFRAPHGVYAEERVEGRDFEVELEAEVSLTAPGTSDALADTVDYRDLSAAAVEVFGGPSVSLVEHLAARVCELVLSRHGAVERVTVTVSKRATGVPGDPARVGVRISRDR